MDAKLLMKRNSDMQQFYYICERIEELFDTEKATYFYIVDKELYDKEGFIDDRHIYDDILDTIPEDMREHFIDTIDECMESIMETQLSETELHEYMKQFPNFEHIEFDTE